jgi:TRAP-type transport system periplasmic protein
MLPTTNFHTPFHRRTLLALTTAFALGAQHVWAQAKHMLRISTPAVPDDWHANMWTVMKEQLDKTNPGLFNLQINLNASLFKQGAERGATWSWPPFPALTLPSWC